MPAINFQQRFAEAVESGEKRQTIRRIRKRPIKVGDHLFFYTGQRTKQCRYLTWHLCRGVRIISIDLDAIWIHAGDGKPKTAMIGKALDRFAKKDGFQDWPEMRDWFCRRHSLPFDGVLIEW
jgi:hypothetical protein